MQCSRTNEGQQFWGSLKLLMWSIGDIHYLWFCIVEYAVVSLTLSLVIAKYFPAIHDQLVSRITREEHQSLYWGTVIVSNILTYGLVFLAGRACSLSYFFYIPLKFILFTLVTLEVVFNTILFVGALVASCRGHGGTGVPIPKGMARIMIYVSSCFCCCVGCSVRFKSKALRILVLFSFMSFIYHSILDVISVTLLLFIEVTRTSTVAFTFLYISLLVFLVLFVSFSLFSLNQHNVSGRQRQCLNCFGNAFIFMAVFGALMLLIAIYMIIVFSLHLQGLSGILTGLIPSVILSSISWYIKNKLLTKEHNTGSSSIGMSELPSAYEINGNEKLEDESSEPLP